MWSVRRVETEARYGEMCISLTQYSPLAFGLSEVIKISKTRGFNIQPESHRIQRMHFPNIRHRAEDEGERGPLSQQIHHRSRSHEKPLYHLTLMNAFFASPSQDLALNTTTLREHLANNHSQSKQTHASVLRSISPPAPTAAQRRENMCT